MSARYVTDIIREMERGSFAIDASAELSKVVAAVQEHGGKGKVSLHLEVSRTSHDDGVLTVTGKLDASVPKPKRRGSIFFADDDHNLLRKDPRQYDIEDQLRDVGEPDHATA